VGKVKTKFSTSLILKKIDKNNLKKHVEKHYGKTKTMWGNIVTIKKLRSKILNQLNMIKKSLKNILEKKRRKKIM
jgi:hypothetical protein